jgi:hypothetical protein
MKSTRREPNFAKMWPRMLFNCKRGNELLVKKEVPILNRPGIYVLYRDDTPYYVGQANVLRRRLRQHANKFTAKHYNLWNYFSAFVVEDENERNTLEGYLIAAMPTANGAKPRLRKAELPREVVRVLQEKMNPTIKLDK